MASEIWSTVTAPLFCFVGSVGAKGAAILNELNIACGLTAPACEYCRFMVPRGLAILRRGAETAVGGTNDPASFCDRSILTPAAPLGACSSITIRDWAGATMFRKASSENRLNVFT